MGNSAPVRLPTDFEMATMHRIRALLDDNSSKSIKGLLKRLWAAAMPPQLAYTVPSPFWQLLGFPDEDPRGPFREGGILPLEQLVYFAEQFPATFVHVVNQVGAVVA